MTNLLNPSPTKQVLGVSVTLRPRAASEASSSKSWEDEVRDVSAQASSSDGTQSIASHDNIAPTSVDDLIKCADVEENSERKALELSLPSKIVFEARNAFRSSVRLGDEAGGRQALERGLDQLCSPVEYDSSPTWLSGRVQILGDLERYEEGRQILARMGNSARHGDVLYDSAIDDENDPDAVYQMNLEEAQERFDSSVHVKDWQMAVEAAKQLLHLDPDYFVFDSPMDRFSKCKRVFHYGLTQENLAPKNPLKAQEHMKKALQIYNQGCFLTNLFHEHFDHPQARITGFDHAVCANLFFSAARVCLYFDEMGCPYPPKDSGCDPPLEASDWKHQALDFLERGKSRALLDSIVRNEILVSSRQRRLLEAVILAANATIGLKRKSSSPSRGNSTPVSLRSSPGPTNDSGQLLPKISEERRMKSIKAHMNWQKALLAALAKLNPTLDSALSVSKYNEKAEEMRSRIPPDTAIVEFAQASEPPEGLMILVMTAERIETASWQAVKIRELKHSVTKLRNLMWPKEESSKAGVPNQESKNEISVAVNFLSDILLRPFKQYFQEKKRLVFIPSGELAHIPWAMLLPEDPLIRSHTVTVIPSLSIWHRLYVRDDNVHRATEMPNISVVSNSPRRKKGKLRDIPFSRIEALYIARMHNNIPILADRESRSAFENQARFTQILHLCAHSNFNYESPMLSKIYLFKGSLTVRDLSEFALGAQLVVFSSCLSGLSRVFDSGGAFSFAHTLLGSGARAFIGTLWPVDDSATLLLMMLFYEQLRTGASPADSLRLAQVKMQNFTRIDLRRLTDKLFDLDDKLAEDYVKNMRYWLQDCLLAKDFAQFREPRCWAAFVLTGYGDKPIYMEQQDSENARRKRKRAGEHD